MESLRINVRPVNSHVVLRVGEQLKSELLIEFVGIHRCQENPPQPLQVGMLKHRAQHQFGHPVTPVFRNDEDIGNVGKRGTIRDHPAKANLLAAAERAEAEGVLDEFLHHSPGNILRPRGRTQETVDQINVESPMVGGDFIKVCRLHFGGALCQSISEKRSSWARCFCPSVDGNAPDANHATGKSRGPWLPRSRHDFHVATAIA